jgi:hypothetical protein
MCVSFSLPTSLFLCLSPSLFDSPSLSLVSILLHVLSFSLFRSGLSHSATFYSYLSICARARVRARHLLPTPS